MPRVGAWLTGLGYLLAVPWDGSRVALVWEFRTAYRLLGDWVMRRARVV